MIGKIDYAKVATQKERNELIGQLPRENKGANTQEPKKKRKKEYHCDSEELQ
jgi:hypothetical protein